MPGRVWLPRLPSQRRSMTLNRSQLVPRYSARHPNPALGAQRLEPQILVVQDYRYLCRMGKCFYDCAPDLFCQTACRRINYITLTTSDN
jgi:hypothetical protein